MWSTYAMVSTCCATMGRGRTRWKRRASSKATRTSEPMQAFLIPDDFRAFMRSVVTYLDKRDVQLFLDAEDALDSECGYGGRIDGVDTYRFKYITGDGHHRWDVVIKEAQIRDIADGLLIEVMA